MTGGRPALIFDFGNVVAYFDYAVACEVLARPRGLSGSELLGRAREAGLSALVKEYESGQLGDEAFSHAVSRIVGIEFPHEEFAAAWADIFTINEPVARLVAELSARGYTLVLGSNTNPIHAAHFRRRLAGTLGHFQRLV